MNVGSRVGVAPLGSSGGSGAVPSYLMITVREERLSLPARSTAVIEYPNEPSARHRESSNVVVGVWPTSSPSR